MIGREAAQAHEITSISTVIRECPLQEDLVNKEDLVHIGQAEEAKAWLPRLAVEPIRHSGEDPRVLLPLALAGHCLGHLPPVDSPAGVGARIEGV